MDVPTARSVYELPEIDDLGGFEELTLGGGGGFVLDEDDASEAMFGSASS